MKLFGQIVRTIVNTAILPVKIVQDVVMWPADAASMDGEEIGMRTKEQIEKIKEEADEQ